MSGVGPWPATKGTAVNANAASDRMFHFLGLGLLPNDPKAAGIAAVRCILGITLLILVLDALLFRRHLDASYVSYYTSAPRARTLPMCFKALWEEIQYRLVFMTGIVAIIRIVLGRVSPTAYVIAAILAQFYGVWPFVVQDPLYASLRYLAVGSVWGLLYWRHGWLAAASGHGATHLILDPLLLVALTSTA